MAAGVAEILQIHSPAGGKEIRCRRTTGPPWPAALAQAEGRPNMALRLYGKTEGDLRAKECDEKNRARMRFSHSFEIYSHFASECAGKQYRLYRMIDYEADQGQIVAKNVLRRIEHRGDAIVQTGH